MAASKIELNPIYLNSKSIELLTEAAASDAKHDFDTFFLKIFSSIGDGNKFKEIGTSILLKDLATPSKEHPTLHKMVDDTGKAILHGSIATDTRWNDEVFPAAAPYEYESGQFALNEVLNPPSKIATNKYILQTRKFDAPDFNAQKLFEFLDSNFGKQKKLYVQQDAGSISYNDKFVEKNGAEDATPYLFYYLNSREGQNDAAGKTTGDSPVVTATQEKKVKVQILQEKTKSTEEEEKERQIIYTQLPNSSLGRTAPYTNNFNSIYNIEVSPIIYEEVKGVLKKPKKTARVCLYFRDENNKVIGSTNKGKRENAVGTLTSILTTFLNKLLKKQKETAPYFQALQQKRGGDWFQCLATFDKERFGLSEKDTVILFTHDLICLAYALANGVNVLFSFGRDSNDKRIMLFKNVNTVSTKGLLSYLDDIQNLNKAVLDRKTDLEANLGLYARSRKRLVKAFNTNLETLTRDGGTFDRKLEELNDPSLVHKTVRELVRELLKTYFEYAFFTNMFPSEQSFISPNYDVSFPSNDADPVVTPTTSYTNSFGNFTAHKQYILDLLRSIVFDTVSPNADYVALFTKLKGKERNSYTKKEDFYRDITTNNERELLESIDAKLTTRKEEIKNELNEKIKELEGFVGSLYTLEKRLNSYKTNIMGLDSIDVTKLTNLTKKIKSKDIDAISLFLDNFNPIPLNVKVDGGGNITKTFRPKNRLSVFANLGGRKTEIEEHNEKSEVDYSVFNYFIGNQLPKGMKGQFIAKLEKIPVKLKQILEGIPASGATLRKHNDLDATIKLYDYFLKETKFHLNENTDWTYEMGLATDVLKKLDMLYVKPPSPVGDMEGGGNQERIMVGGEIELSEKNKEDITKFLLTEFPDFFPENDSFDTAFLENLDNELRSGPKGVIFRKALPSILVDKTFKMIDKVNDEEYNDICVEYNEFLMSEGQIDFNHIKTIRNKINIDKVTDFVLNIEELRKIITTTKIARIAAEEANRIATEAVAAAERDAAAAQTAKDAAVVAAGATPTEKIAAAKTVAEGAATAAASAAAAARSKLGQIQGPLGIVVAKADAVVAAVTAASSASGAPPTPESIAAAEAAAETANLPESKSNAIDVCTKAKEIVEQAKLATEKLTEATLAKSKIDVLTKKSTFLSRLFPRLAGTPSAAPTGAVANGSADASRGSAAAGASAPAVAAADSSEIPTAFETEIDDIIDRYINEEAIISKEAIKDTKNENVLLSTPEALYLDILMRYRELHRPSLVGPEAEAELKIIDTPNEKFESLEEAMNTKLDVFRKLLTRKYAPALLPSVEANIAAKSAVAVAKKLEQKVKQEENELRKLTTLAGNTTLSAAQRAKAVEVGAKVETQLAESRGAESAAQTAKQAAEAAANARRPNEATVLEEARAREEADTLTAAALARAAEEAAARAAAEAGHSGGARDAFTINNVSVPFLGWTTLYFYGLSLLQELEDTKHVSDGFDYPYLARQAQFFLSMVHSMYTHVLPNQKGGGGQGSPNQSSGSTVMTVSSNTNMNSFTRVAAEKKYNSYLKLRADKIDELLKTYAIGNQCDLFLTNILPRLEFIQSADAQALKQSIFDAMGIGEGYGWIAYFSGIQNDFFFGQSMDSSLDSEVDFKNPFLQRFLQTTLETLKSSPPYDFTDEAKYAAQAKIRQSLDKLIDFLNNTEHDLVKQMYQEILINRAEEKKKTAQATRKIQTINTFRNQRKNSNSLTNEINKIMNYTYANFCDLQFLMANGLVKEEGKRLGPGPLTTEFDTQRHSVILQSIPNGLQRFKELEPKLQANPQLKEKYIQRIKNLNTYREAKNLEKYNSAFKALQSFLENPDNPGLLTGGTRRTKGKNLRLKSRHRTHKKR